VKEAAETSTKETSLGPKKKKIIKNKLKHWCGVTENRQQEPWHLLNKCLWN